MLRFRLNFRASKMKYRSFCYTDWLNEFMTNPSPMKPEYIDMLLDEVKASGSDVFVFNPNGQTVVYPSDVWQTMWDRYLKNPATAFGEISEDKDDFVCEHEAMMHQMLDLKNAGCDIMERVTVGCKKRNLACGISLRMNDVHGHQWGKCYLISDFWFDNPQLRNPAPYITLNYEHAQVREHYLKLIREIIQRYEFDVLDLDFLRNPTCFPENQGRKLAPVMTEFFQEVKQEINHSKKNIKLMVRTVADPNLALFYGFDIKTLSDKNLIDGVVPGNHLHSTWMCPIKKIRECVGDSIAIYPSSDYFADTRENLPDRIMGLEKELMRGFAASQLATGADGIYWFNYVVVRQANTLRLMDKPKHRDECRPCFEAIGEGNGLKNLRSLPKTYIVPSINANVGYYDSPVEIPADLIPWQSRKFSLYLSEEPTLSKAVLKIMIKSESSRPEMIELRSFNGNVLPQRVSISALENNIYAASYSIPISLLNNGKNAFVITNGESKNRIIGADINVE